MPVDAPAADPRPAPVLLRGHLENIERELEHLAYLLAVSPELLPADVTLLLFRVNATVRYAFAALPAPTPITS